MYIVNVSMRQIKAQFVTNLCSIFEYNSLSISLFNFCYNYFIKIYI